MPPLNCVITFESKSCVSGLGVGISLTALSIAHASCKPITIGKLL